MMRALELIKQVKRFLDFAAAIQRYGKEQACKGLDEKDTK
jgi:hypothetical protein